MSTINAMPRSNQVVSTVAGLSLIGCILSSDYDTSFFSSDDSSSLTVDSGPLENAESPQLNWILGQAGSGWETSESTSKDLFDPNVLDAFCVGDEPQAIGKSRHRRQACAQDITSPTLPNLIQLDPFGLQDQDTEKLLELDGTKEEEELPCPDPYREHVCCLEAGITSSPASGIVDFVTGCSACSSIQSSFTLINICSYHCD